MPVLMSAYARGQLWRPVAMQDSLLRGRVKGQTDEMFLGRDEHLRLAEIKRRVMKTGIGERVETVAQMFADRTQHRLRFQSGWDLSCAAAPRLVQFDAADAHALETGIQRQRLQPLREHGQRTRVGRGFLGNGLVDAGILHRASIESRDASA